MYIIFLSTSTLTMDFYAKVTVGGWSMAQQVIYHKMTHTHTSFLVEFMYYSSKLLRHRTGSRSITRLSYPSLFLKASVKLGKVRFVLGTQCSKKFWVAVRNGWEILFGTRFFAVFGTKRVNYSEHCVRNRKRLLFGKISLTVRNSSALVFRTAVPTNIVGTGVRLYPLENDTHKAGQSK